MTNDTISRQAALQAMDTWDKFGCGPDGKLVRYDDDNHYVPYVHYDDMVHTIKHLPPAQPDFNMVEKIDKAYDDGYKCGYLQAKFDYEADMRQRKEKQE